MGTANSGHYYSYIRPRDGGGEWLEFNDTVVSTFDVEVRCGERERVCWFTSWPDADRRVWLFHMGLFLWTLVCHVRYVLEAGSAVMCRSAATAC